MNQVTEILRLTREDQREEAVDRLCQLFEMMQEQPGFLNAEVLVSTQDPRLLLVLHGWQEIGDWQEFRNSDAKISFMATRPASLYAFVPCGTNWLFRRGTPEKEAAPFLRREVLRADAGEVAANSGARVFSYQDYEPEFAGTCMRLTRLASVPEQLRPGEEATVIADDVFESLVRIEPRRVSNPAVSSRGERA